jgi:hypothetical protein
LDYSTALTARRIWVHDNWSDGLKLYGNDTVLEHSLIEKIGKNSASGHHDGIQMDGAGGSFFIARYNAIEGEKCEFPQYHWSNALITGDASVDLQLIGNWLDGGGSMIVNGSNLRTTFLKDNRWGTYIADDKPLWSGGNFVNQGGNIWDCDGSAISSGLDPKPSCRVPYPGPTCQ